MSCRQLNMFHFNTFGIPVTVLQWVGMHCDAPVLLNSFFKVLWSVHLEITFLRVIPTMKFQNNHVRFYVSANVSGEGRHTTHLMKCVRLLSTSQIDWKQSVDMCFDLLSDILSGYLLTFWQIFWHSSWQSFWHIFWQSFWHIPWHSVWHIFWHSFSHIFWHSFSHIFWHSV